MNTVFLDIDTQFDFLYPAGALYVPKAELIVPAVAALNRFAAEHGIPVVSTADAHAENDPEFAVWPPHCVAGTLGQRKPEATLLERRIVVPSRERAPLLCDAQQIVLEKQTVKTFEAIQPLLPMLQADRYVVYGVVTEICVLHAARGLLATGKPVAVVTDAVKALSADASARVLEELRAADAELTTVSRTCG
jgi:nicotinamidase/pyrazinamidase